MIISGKIVRVFTAAILLCFTVCPLWGQESWSLENCIRFALQNNQGLHQIRLDELIAELDLRQSRRNRLPAVALSSDAGMNYGRSVDPNTNLIVNHAFFNNSYSMGLSVDLFRGFMLQSRIRFRKHRMDAARAQGQDAIDELAFEVTAAYYDVIFYRGLAEIADQQKEFSELNLQRMHILVQTGLRAPVDLLDGQARLEEAELVQVQTTNELEKALMTLQRTMNTNEKPDVLPAVADRDVFTRGRPDNPSLVYESHVQWSPRVLMGTYQLQSSLQNVSASRSGFLPALRFQAAYGTGFYETNKDAAGGVIAFGTQLQNNQRQFIGLSLSIPVFGRGAAHHEVKRAGLEADQATARLDQTRQELLFEITENHNRLLALQKEWSQLHKQIEADQLAFRAAQKQYAQGLIGVIELYSAQNRLASTRSQLLRTELSLQLCWHIFDFYQGRRFWEN